MKGLLPGDIIVPDIMKDIVGPSLWSGIVGGAVGGDVIVDNLQKKDRMLVISVSLEVPGYSGHAFVLLGDVLGYVSIFRVSKEF